MLREAAIPQFSSKDFPIMVATMLPMTFLTNYFLFGNRYFRELEVLAWSTLVTFLILCIAFFFYGLIAISLQDRFPLESQTVKRLAICIPLFVLLSGVVLSVVFRVYETTDFLGYEFTETAFLKCYASFATINVFLTFFNEGVSKFEKYKATITETAQLKKEYSQGQLLGLKSQMNPHFLFNSLNTLSSLIHEDAEKAEDFLDHMSKVYRYLLRNNDVQLVPLETELGFISSYYYLLKARHAEGLQLKINVPEEFLDKMIPPLTLQMIFENAMNNNAISKQDALVIEIDVYENLLQVKNNLRPKVNGGDSSSEGLDNVANKFRLLCGENISIKQTPTSRLIQLPVIQNKEKITA
jgi:sensor histidine kinase YesM